MIGDLLRAVAQLGDRKFLRVFAVSIAITVLTLVAFMFGWTWIVGTIPDTGWVLWGYDLGFLDAVAAILAWTAGAVGAIFLMFPVAALVIGFFLEDIADAVEARHYPQLPPAGRLGWGELIADGLVFALALIVANLIGLALYLVSGPFAPFVFIAVNGWLLGRQYFELVAMRRIGTKAARKLRKRLGGQVWLAGVLMAVGLSVPLLGLAVPVLGVAAFTHLYHRVQGDRFRE